MNTSNQGVVVVNRLHSIWNDMPTFLIYASSDDWKAMKKLGELSIAYLCKFDGAKHQIGRIARMFSKEDVEKALMIDGILVEKVTIPRDRAGLSSRALPSLNAALMDFRNRVPDEKTAYVITMENGEVLDASEQYKPQHRQLSLFLYNWDIRRSHVAFMTDDQYFKFVLQMPDGWQIHKVSGLKFSTDEFLPCNSPALERHIFDLGG